MLRLMIFALLVFTQLVDVKAASIHDAAKKGDIVTLAAAIDAGTDLNKMSGGATPLYHTAIRGHLEAAKLLIAHGADVNLKTKFGTPLMAAAARDTPEIVELLLAKGADPNAELDSRTALHVAAERGCLGCVEALVKAGENVNAQQKTGNGVLTLIVTPLHLAIANNRAKIANYLRSHGVTRPQLNPISGKLAAADIAKGQEIFERDCRGCHSSNLTQAVKFGPTLWNVVGRDKASLDYGEYSSALLALEGTWTFEDLNTFLSGPTVTTPGVKMEVKGVPDENDRIDLIAYLRTLSGNPIPLP